MFGLTPTHLILILVIALIIFGPARLPELGRALGKSINEFRSANSELVDSLNQPNQSTQPGQQNQPAAKESPAETSPDGPGGAA